MFNNLTKIAVIFVFIVFIITSYNYPGSKIAYIFFSLFFNYFFFNKINKHSYFSEIYISTYLWLGFWFKFSLLNIFSSKNILLSRSEGHREVINSYLSVSDSVMITSVIFIIGLNLGFFIIKKTNFFLNIKELDKRSFFFVFYNNYRIFILTLYIFFFLFVNFVNYFFSIYEKGLINDKENFLILNIFFKFIYNIGLPFISALLIYLELRREKVNVSIFSITLAASFFSNLTQLSRAMISEFTPTVFSSYLMITKQKINIKKKLFIKIILFFIFLSFLSVYLVDKFREDKFKYNLITNNSNQTEINNSFSYTPDLKKNTEHSYYIEFKKFLLKILNYLDNLFYLLTNRWVGIDALFFVHLNQKNLSLSFLYDALNEKQDLQRHTFYEINFLFKDYKVINKNVDNKIIYGFILPGVVAFLYYSGSNLFVFILSLIIGYFLLFIENIMKFFLFNNLIVVSFFSHLIVHRIIHFGYLPLNSFFFLLLIFWTIIIYYFIIYFFFQSKNK
jgi:hypothetical protein